MKYRFRLDDVPHTFDKPMISYDEIIRLAGAEEGSIVTCGYPDGVLTDIGKGESVNLTDTIPAFFTMDKVIARVE